MSVAITRPYEERIELWNLENKQFEELVIQPALNYYDRYFQRAPVQIDRGLGWRNIWRRLQQDAAACLQLLRMSLPCFTTLCNMLQTNYDLQPTLNISIEESVAMFLRICGHNEVYRDVGLRFGRNQETVQRKFREVLTATELLACDYIRTPTRQELYRIPERLQVDQRYWPYFSGFVGAMDGTHVCVKVKPDLQGMYWNRHDNASLNIMAICDLKMLFTYIWNGAPGSCYDTAVLQIAQQSDSEFPLPPSEKYYLVDSGYPNKQGLLAPYRSSRNRVVRYHMSQFYYDADFADVMTETNINNRDFDYDLDDKEATEITDGEHITQIGDNVANMLWENQIEPYCTVITLFPHNKNRGYHSDPYMRDKCGLYKISGTEKCLLKELIEYIYDNIENVIMKQIMKKYLTFDR
ncbi:Hypothetical protein [Arabidopsis thaliana]|uniref:F2J6.9 protein n=1 Tax=Arabidopsis thaliana TaxID=3702 RepID=Q9MA72_ARATH|nr:Hypothetical protein [Arabidopsis thaliana]